MSVINVAQVPLHVAGRCVLMGIADCDKEKVMTKYVAIPILLLVAVVPGFAKKVHAPLPHELLAAKTVCVSPATDEGLRDRAFQEIAKAKHFTFVADCSAADLIFSFEIHSAGYVGGYSTPGIQSNITPSGQIYHRGHTVYDETFSVVDTKTGKVLWQEVGYETKRAVNRLIKRIREQGK